MSFIGPVLGLVLVAWLLLRSDGAPPAALPLLPLSGIEEGPFSTMEYQGVTYRLSRTYANYDDYKNDPENIAPEEIPKIEKAMTEVRIPTETASDADHIMSLVELPFPGYGTSGNRFETGGLQLDLTCIEIPRVDKDRVLTFQVKDHRYVIMDDFVTSTRESRITDVRMERGLLRYLDRNGKVIREVSR
jgi:hypothetical protein